MADDVNVGKDVAFCRQCNEAFDLSSIVETQGSSPVQRAPQPPDSKVVFTRDESRIALALPPGGFRGAGCFFTLFSAFWNLITWGVFLAFAASSLNGNSPFDAWTFLFFIPHMAIGVLTAIMALYCVRGDMAIAMDARSVLMQRRLFGYTWARTMPFEAITAVCMKEAYQQNDTPVYGVGILFEGARDERFTHAASGSSETSGKKARAMVFGSGLTPAEKAWLVGELDDFWRSHRAK
jgi:hypothetical protein